MIIWNHCQYFETSLLKLKIHSSISYYRQSPLIDNSGHNFTTKGLDCRKDTVTKTTIPSQRLRLLLDQENFPYGFELTFENAVRPLTTYYLMIWDFVLIKFCNFIETVPYVILFNKSRQGTFSCSNHNS